MVEKDLTWWEYFLGTVYYTCVITTEWVKDAKWSIKKIFCRHDWIGNLQIPRKADSSVYGRHSVTCDKCYKQFFYRMDSEDIEDLDARHEAYYRSIGRTPYWK